MIVLNRFCEMKKEKNRLTTEGLSVWRHSFIEASDVYNYNGKGPRFPNREPSCLRSNDDKTWLLTFKSSAACLASTAQNSRYLKKLLDDIKQMSALCFCANIDDFNARGLHVRSL